MNLYKVMPITYDWCCYIFAETRNKAKSMLVGHFDDDNKYIDFRCETIKKNVDGNSQICDVDCNRLKNLKITYDKEK